MGFTYLDPKSGLDISAAATVLFNTENMATQYLSGDVLQIDFAACVRPLSNVNVGLVGYVMEQLTPDSGTGANFGANYSHVVGLGPAAGYTFNLGGRLLNLQAKFYREFLGENTTVGNSGSLTLRFKF